MRSKVNFTIATLIAAVMMVGCTNSTSLDKAYTMFDMEHGEGGTRLPHNPGHLVNVGLSTPTEVTTLFGQPQFIQSFDWGQVITYRYWENRIGTPRYEEFVEFKFNERGFLDEIKTYANNGELETSLSTSSEIERDKECPKHMKVCQSYKTINN